MRAGWFIVALAVSGVLAPTIGRANDAATFKSIRGPGMAVSMTTGGHPVLGASVTEKHGAGFICLRTVAATPAAKPVVECFHAIATGSAKAIFDALPPPAIKLGFTAPGDMPIVGASTAQKRDGGILCREVTPSVPTPVLAYTCYAR